MKKKDAVANLNYQVKDFFELHGFKSYETPYETGWIKEIENGDVYFIGLGYVPRISINTGKKESYQIEPELTICIDEIEQHYKKISLNESLKYVIDYRTLSARLGLLKGYPTGIINSSEHYFCNWVAHDIEDFKNIGLQVVDIVKQVALPYIEKNANVFAVDKLINENLTEQIVHIGTLPNRAIRGLIAARLVGRKNLADIMRYYDVIMNEATPNLQAEYKAIKSTLHSIRQKQNILNPN